ncbi:sugar lactone lactonase YvrE [Pseudomonas psychrotolerans]|nr:sugar lactone lactonase YvrE [Pseudomonas psychrotolerans]
MDWQPLLPQRFKLAEGPFWDQQTKALYWVDIAGFKACRLHGEHYQEWQLDRPCSAFVPTVRGDALVTLPDGVFRLDLDSPEDRPRLEPLLRRRPRPGQPRQRSPL